MSATATATGAITLGAKYRDKITGFTGTATGYATYISGCAQVLIAPAMKPDGAFEEGRWFDEQRLESVGGDRITLDNRRTPGPDKPAPVR